MDRRVRVQRHGLRYRLNGFPIYERDGWSDEDVIVGVVYEPKWAEADLTARHRREVDRLVAEQEVQRPDSDRMTPDELRYVILEWLGVEHEHRKGEPVLDYRPAYGYKCSMCKSYILAKEPGDSPFYGGPLNGRWLVTGGLRTFRVPIPVAVTVSSDLPVPVSMPVIEYRRGSDGAYYVDRQSYPETSPRAR